MAEVANKRLKADGPLIGTHSGHFHADEALAVYLLRMLPNYRDSDLVRTRDPKKLAECHTVVDVGGEYTPSRDRYDHHQRGFEATFPGRGTKLSSAGLVFMHFGKAIIAQQLGQNVEAPEVQLIWEKLYAEFIEALDAHDNGISAYDPTAVMEKGLSKRFFDGGVTLGAMVGDLNPNWNDPPPPAEAGPDAAQKGEDEKFLEASNLMGTTFVRKLKYLTSAWLPARVKVQEAFAKREKPAGRVIVLDQGMPWKDHLYSLEDESDNIEASILYVLYPESLEPGTKWRIQTVSVSKDSFVSRKPLPEAWRGLRDEELDAVTGVPGGVFVHAAGFIGGHKTIEGVKALAKKALEE